MADLLAENGVRVSVDGRNEKLGYRIREAQTSKIPLEIVVGDGEIADQSVTVRRYGRKEAVKMTLDEFLAAVNEEINSRSLA